MASNLHLVIRDVSRVRLWGRTIIKTMPVFLLLLEGCHGLLWGNVAVVIAAVGIFFGTVSWTGIGGPPVKSREQGAHAVPEKP